MWYFLDHCTDTRSDGQGTFTTILNLRRWIMFCLSDTLEHHHHHHPCLTCTDNTYRQTNQDNTANTSGTLRMSNIPTRPSRFLEQFEINMNEDEMRRMLGLPQIPSQAPVHHQSPPSRATVSHAKPSLIGRITDAMHDIVGPCFGRRKRNLRQRSVGVDVAMGDMTSYTPRVYPREMPRLLPSDYRTPVQGRGREIVSEEGRRDSVHTLSRNQENGGGSEHIPAPLEPQVFDVDSERVPTLVHVRSAAQRRFCVAEIACASDEESTGSVGDSDSDEESVADLSIPCVVQADRRFSLCSASDEESDDEPDPMPPDPVVQGRRPLSTASWEEGDDSMVLPLSTRSVIEVNRRFSFSSPSNNDADDTAGVSLPSSSITEANRPCSAASWEEGDDSNVLPPSPRCVIEMNRRFSLSTSSSEDDLDDQELSSPNLPSIDIETSSRQSRVSSALDDQFDMLRSKDVPEPWPGGEHCEPLCTSDGQFYFPDEIEQWQEENGALLFASEDQACLGRFLHLWEDPREADIDPCLFEGF